MRAGIVALAIERPVDATSPCWLEPPGFSCSPMQVVNPNDSLQCTGPSVAKAPLAGGRIHTVPPPGTNLDAQLFVFQGATQLGPFPTSGP